MNSCLATLALIPLLAAAGDDSAAVELRYTGALTRVKEAEGTAVKRFSLYAAVRRAPAASRRLVWFLNERGGGGWSWPERFGAADLNAEWAPQSASAPRLLYEYEGNPVVVPLPYPVARFAAPLKAGASWMDGKETWEVGKQQKRQDRDCWPIHVSTSFGRKRTLWVDAAAPVVVALEERVFVGQGDEHTLTMQLDALTPLDVEQWERDTQALPALLELQAALARKDNEHRPELSAAQLQLAADALPRLQQAAADTPFSALVSAVAKDIKTQSLRTDEVARLAEKFVGQPAPDVSLRLTDRTTVDADALRGDIVVLHFWEYQNEPLVEPYGQIGYLDFLHGKRRKLGVQVYGIAVDSRLADEQTAAGALKSIQRLKQFMNLGYGIATDDGKLLAKFGDPRKYGAELPLWVVIGPDGRIVHYHCGFYKINPDEGLQELDEVLVKLVREKKDRGK